MQLGLGSATGTLPKSSARRLAIGRPSRFSNAMVYNMLWLCQYSNWFLWHWKVAIHLSKQCCGVSFV
uniref:Uncharacterized protein n=1 Tax=Romanomermis culicivorax TaxID=13658 RepID=A0A915IVS2_ROMCU